MAEPGLLDGERAIYLVLMDGEPVAFRQGATPPGQHNRESCKAHAARLVESHDQLLQSTLDAGSYNKLCSFHHIVDGFAVHTTPSQAMRLELAPGVLRIEKDRGAELMTTYTPHLLGLPQGIWSREGGEKHAGEGITIGVIDTGIDPTHPSFAYDPSNPYEVHRGTQFSDGACQLGTQFPVGSCNGKIVSARYFSAGATAALRLNASKDLSPFDQVGHGSHVASIAAGNWGVPVVANGFMYGSASGMAPRARLAIYKAIYPEGGTIADLVSAIDQAAQDRVDVIVLSVGPNEPPEVTPTFMSVFAISLLFARRAGLFVVQAAGNKGPGEATVVSFSPWTMGVAASTTGRSYTPTLIMGDGRQLHGVGLSAPTPGDGHIPFKLVSARDAASANRSHPASTLRYMEDCQHPEALQPAVVLGSIVICSFSESFLNGTSTVAAILDCAKALRFIGFILVANPQYGDFIAEPLPFPIPGIMIPRVADAQILWEYYEKHTYRDSRGAVISYSGSAAIGEGRVAAFTDPAPIVARFSSRGPDIIDNKMNPADVLKPDILAPGQQIWAAWSPTSALDPILSGNHFALLSGTSMATPHIAGVAALVKQTHPSWTPSMIASAMSTTAKKHDDRGQPIMAQGPELYSLYPSTPFDHGAGFINPSAALDPGLVFSSGFEDYISFLCSLPNIDPTAVRSATGTPCNKPFESPSDLNLPSITISALRGFQLVRRSVKNVANRTETYSCSIQPPEGIKVSVQPSWFHMIPEGTQHLEIKFNITHASDSFRFGEIVLTGALDHIVRLPLAVLPVSLQ
ncbi:subtilisin-like protease SBT2.4 [Phoenix dactylifera]|uniref:Subtilisin-like protease SBT2.4 n=1 Tax=Phoenix dactylifera TaxID=42345 RepID=A0A8B9AR29_PHODC|nr:subtilisin-like protease SBT2.4 [Phoenix dactylifera]